jgi:hypothetical protein
MDRPNIATIRVHDTHVEGEEQHSLPFPTIFCCTTVTVNRDRCRATVAAVHRHWSAECSRPIISDPIMIRGRKICGPILPKSLHTSATRVTLGNSSLCVLECPRGHTHVNTTAHEEAKENSFL